VRLEEVHLRKLFGTAYDNYCARTPRFIPGAYLLSSNRPAR
jgi:protein-S-isoprenylcysteine O-methyltransferase Ste14